MNGSKVNKPAPANAHDSESPGQSEEEDNQQGEDDNEPHYDDFEEPSVS